MKNLALLLTINKIVPTSALDHSFKATCDE